jgi:dolichol-phosphate hexosyltransferase
VKLTIAIPLHGDSPDLTDVVKNALAVDYGCPVEVLIVRRPGQPASADNGAFGVLDAFDDDPRVRLITAEGWALAAAAEAADGDHLVELDAWQEYDPEDIARLLEPARAGHATVVFGRRMFGAYSGNPFWYVVGNKLITIVGNIIFNCYLSDLETGYKLMPVALHRSLQASGDTALTGRLLRRGLRPYEVPVFYRGHPAGQGGRLRWWNRIGALAILLRERLRPV